MLSLEHSAILLTCIRRLLGLKTNLGVFESGRYRQVLLYHIYSNEFPISYKSLEVLNLHEGAMVNVKLFNPLPTG